MKKKILIQGMNCGHCVNHVKEALRSFNGVDSAEVDLKGKYSILEANIDIKDEDIKLVIDDAGYEVVGIEII